VWALSATPLADLRLVANPFVAGHFTKKRREFFPAAF
jgi:hypothetical protein